MKSKILLVLVMFIAACIPSSLKAYTIFGNTYITLPILNFSGATTIDYNLDFTFPSDYFYFSEYYVSLHGTKADGSTFGASFDFSEGHFSSNSSDIYLWSECSNSVSITLNVPGDVTQVYVEVVSYTNQSNSSLYPYAFQDGGLVLTGVNPVYATSNDVDIIDPDNSTPPTETGELITGFWYAIGQPSGAVVSIARKPYLESSATDFYYLVRFWDLNTKDYANFWINCRTRQIVSTSSRGIGSSISLSPQVYGTTMTAIGFPQGNWQVTVWAADSYNTTHPLIGFFDPGEVTIADTW